MRNDAGVMVCDRCGGDVGGGGVDQAAIVTMLDEEHRVHTLLFCLRKDDTHDGCASRIFTSKATAHRNDNTENRLTFYKPPVDAAT